MLFQQLALMAVAEFQETEPQSSRAFSSSAWSNCPSIPFAKASHTPSLQPVWKRATTKGHEYSTARIIGAIIAILHHKLHPQQMEMQSLWQPAMDHPRW
jgi:hypothetical protein